MLELHRDRWSICLSVSFQFRAYRCWCAPRATRSTLVPTIRERIWALDPNVPLDKIYPLEQKVAEATTSPRFTLLLVGLFAGLGLVLAAVGIYGVMSFAVTERTKEIGIRRALGAQEAAIVWAVIRQGMTLALLGLMSGLVIAVWATRLMTTLLFGVSGTDPLTFAGVSSVIDHGRNVGMLYPCTAGDEGGSAGRVAAKSRTDG